MTTGRNSATRPQDTMRLMAAAAGVVAVLAGLVGVSQGDRQLMAVGVAFAALAIYLYARWRDVSGTGSAGLLGTAVVCCAAACIGLAATGFWWFAVCLAVPTLFGVVRFSGRRAPRS